jgi:hypothetical protein
METIVKLRTNKDEYDIRNASAYSYTVGQVIDILSRCPQNAKIVFDNDRGYTFGAIDSATIRVVEVETFQEEKEREEREKAEEEMEEIKDIINGIKKAVNANGGELILALDGITLDTCCEEQEDNLIVTELTTKMGGKLYGNTNWGLINLEETITDTDDWYTIDDVVADL